MRGNLLPDKNKRTNLETKKMFAVSLSIDMYEAKIVNRKKSLKVSGEVEIETSYTI